MFDDTDWKLSSREHFQKDVAGRKGRLIARQLENLVEFLQNLFPLRHSLTWIIL